MKRIKIMLLSFALLAIVGGALAFKARFSDFLCYTTQYIANSKTTCPTLTGFKEEELNPATFYTTTPIVIAGESTCITNGKGLTCFSVTTSTFE